MSILDPRCVVVPNHVGEFEIDELLNPVDLSGYRLQVRDSAMVEKHDRLGRPRTKVRS